LPGILAVIALATYAIMVLAIFKLIPVTLTLAGIAGFILSLGMAVDANVLIFERIKEELKSGRSLGGSIDEGFKRAWPSIRDGNVSTIITAIILFWFGTSIIKGFALTLLVGVLVSMFTAIVITKLFLKLFAGEKLEKIRWIYGK
jgi:preprotein translocase subunit SecD